MKKRWLPSIFLLALLPLFLNNIFGQVTMDQLICINARATDPWHRMLRFPFVREYHDWSLDARYGNSSSVDDCSVLNLSVRWNPGGDAENTPFDAFYERFSGRVCPVLKGVAPEMRGMTAFPICMSEFLEQKPICISNYANNWTPGDYSNTNCGFDPGTCSYQGGINLMPLPTMPSLDVTTSPTLFPDTYLPHSIWTSLFAARYGTNEQVTEVRNFLYNTANNLIEDENTLTGPGWVTFIENNNEPDKSWYENDRFQNCSGYNTVQEILNSNTSPPWYFTPEEYACMLSADFDGHQNNSEYEFLNENGAAHHWGVNNRAPGVTMVMAGLADLRGQYVERMIDWFNENRGGNYPMQVLNFHHYSSDASSAKTPGDIYISDLNTPLGSIGVSPEKDDLRGKLSYLLTTVSGYAGIQNNANFGYWLSEFGYDTNSGSNQRVPDNFADQQEVQGQWLVRSYLAISAAAGGGEQIERAMAFCIRDDATLGNGLFGNSGLLDSDFKPKKSWYYVLTLSNVLAGMHFDNQLTGLTSPACNLNLECGEACPWIYRYGGNSQTIYTIWYPTSCGKDDGVNPASWTEITLPAGVDLATLITMEDGDEDGKYQEIPVNTVTNKVKVRISERPVFLLLSQAITDQTITCEQGFPNLQATSISCDAVRLTWDLPVGIEYLTYQIYYAKKSEMPDPTEFDIADERVTTYTDELGGWLDNAVVAGLDKCTEYWFFIRGVTSDGVVTEILCNNPVKAKTMQCGCAIGRGLFTTSLNLGQGHGNQSAYNTAAVESLFDYTLDMDNNNVDEPINLCNLKGTVPITAFPNDNPDGWEAFSYTPVPNTNPTQWFGDELIVRFNTHVFLDVIYLLEGSGNAEVEFQWSATEFCDDFQQLLLFEKRSFLEWNAITDFDHLAPIKRLKIIKYKRDGNLGSEAGIARLVFCGKKATGIFHECQQPPPPERPADDCPPDTLAEISNPSMDWLSSTQVEVEWDAVNKCEGDEVYGKADNYLVRYSNSIRDGELVNPEEKSVAADVEAATVNTVLEDANIQPSIQARVTPCACPIIADPGVPVPRASDESFGENSNATAFESELTLKPNPANGFFQVITNWNGFATLEILDASGTVRQFLSLDKSQSFKVDCSDLPAGLYTVSFKAKGAKPVHQKLLIVK